ncbi:MAG: hypothetical protein AB4042_17240, partial [Leptolyngbyaceae cyanobacterium]
LGDRINAIVTLDEKRRTIAPQQISDAIAAVRQSRQQLCHTLQSLKQFQTGIPDRVLREPGHDPSEPIAIAEAHLDELKTLLDEGNVGRSQSHLETIKAEIQTAHHLVKATNKAMNDYQAQQPLLTNQIFRLRRHCQETTVPTLATLQQTYTPAALEIAVSELDAGQTIVDNDQLVIRLLDQATSALNSANDDMDQAQILSATQRLAPVEELLREAKAKLGRVEKIRDRLGQKHGLVEQKYAVLSGPVRQMLGQLNHDYINLISPTTNALGKQLSHQIDEAKRLIQSTPRNPYDAEKLVREIEQLWPKVEGAIANDKRTRKALEASIKPQSARLDDLEFLNSNELDNIGFPKPKQSYENLDDIEFQNPNGFNDTGFPKPKQSYEDLDNIEFQNLNGFNDTGFPKSKQSYEDLDGIEFQNLNGFNDTGFPKSKRSYEDLDNIEFQNSNGFNGTGFPKSKRSYEDLDDIGFQNSNGFNDTGFPKPKRSYEDLDNIEFQNPELDDTRVPWSKHSKEPGI